jgi:anti-sigma factor RsiW
VVLSSTSELRKQALPVDGTASKTEPSERWLSNLLDHHVALRKPTSSRPSLLRGIEVRVGVPVRLPDLERVGAQWVGATVIPWDSTNAALLQYRLRQHRVTVYVYDSDRTPLRTSASLHPRVVRNAVVFLGERRGYSVAVIEKLGLGRAVVSEVSPDECAELAMAMDEP